MEPVDSTSPLSTSPSQSEPMEQKKSERHYYTRVKKLSKNLILTFENNDQEHAFQTLYQAELPKHTFLYGILWFLIVALIQLPFYRNQRQNGFDWSSNDPRTVYFAQVMVAVTLSSVVCLISRVPFQAAKFFKLEIIIVTIVAIHLMTLTFITPWHIAIYHDTDFNATWPGIPFTFSESEQLVALGLVVHNTVVTQFVNIRMRLLWIVNAAVIVSYTASVLTVGSPLSPGIAISTGCLLATLVVLAWAAAWRNERHAREKWLMMQRTAEDLEKAQMSAKEVHKAFVTEKVKRFDAERQLQQVQGKWQQKASSAQEEMVPPHADDTATRALRNWAHIGPKAKPECSGDLLKKTANAVNSNQQEQLPVCGHSSCSESLLPSFDLKSDSTTACLGEGQSDCLSPSTCVWVKGEENPMPLTSVKPGMQILTVEHSPGSPATFAPVKAMSINAADGENAPVWLRAVLADGSETVMTAGHCVFPFNAGRQPGAVQAQNLRPGVDALMVMSTRPVLIRSLEQMPASEAPSESVWLEVEGCEKVGEQGENGRSVLVSVPPSKSDKAACGAFVAVCDAQAFPAPVEDRCISESGSIGQPSIPRTNSGSQGAVVILNGPSTPVGRLPVTADPVWLGTDQRHRLKVKNTFFDIVSQPGSENSNEEILLPWTDERAGLVYGSYPQWGASPQSRPLIAPRNPSLGTPTIVSHSLSGGTSISSRERPSDMSSEDNSGPLVLLGEQAPGKSTSQVHMSEFLSVPRHPTTGEITSIGSAGHFNGCCKPCEWMQRGRPCKYGWRCQYCHIVDEHAKYSRKNRKAESNIIVKQQNPLRNSYGGQSKMSL